MLATDLAGHTSRLGRTEAICPWEPWKDSRPAFSELSLALHILIKKKYTHGLEAISLLGVDMFATFGFLDLIRNLN
jgi:hypothetical protein